MVCILATLIFFGGTKRNNIFTCQVFQRAYFQFGRPVCDGQHGGDAFWESSKKKRDGTREGVCTSTPVGEQRMMKETRRMRRRCAVKDVRKNNTLLSSINKMNDAPSINTPQEESVALESK